MSNNSNLHKAKKAKNDEFFTQLSDIENELIHYREHFSDKVVYCNCDDPTQSNFVKYFQINFDKLNLKKLIATGYRKDGRGLKLVYDSNCKDANVQELEGDGDFRSEEARGRKRGDAGRSPSRESGAVLPGARTAKVKFWIDNGQLKFKRL